MIEPKAIEYTLGDNVITVTVYAADGIRGTRRNRVRSEQLDEIKRLSELKPPAVVDKDEFIFRVTYYPDCIGASDILIDGIKTEPPYDVFKTWPDELIGQIIQATDERNPHWTDPDYNKKKVTT